MIKNITPSKVLFALMTSILLCNSIMAQDKPEVEEYKFPEDLSSALSEGCTFDLSDDVTIIENSCNGVDDGRIEVALSGISGGVGPFSILTWSGNGVNGSTDSIITDLSPGPYTVFIQDDGDLTSCSFEFGFLGPNAINVLLWNETAPSCFGIEDGSVNPIVNGGTGTLEFNYNGTGFTTNAMGSMLGNTFNLVVMDENDCLFEDDHTFADVPSEIMVDSTITNTCVGLAQGSIVLTETGVNTPYTYVWDGPDPFTSMDKDIFDLEAGTYTVEITDANLCSITKVYEIENNPDIEYTVTVDDIQCADDMDGAITFTDQMGLTPFDFEWTGPNTIVNNQDQVDLPAGSFSVEITDQGGCVVMDDFEISALNFIEIDEVLTDVSCFGEFDGSIDVTTTGGSGTFDSFTWDVPACYLGPTDEEDISNACGGNYELTVVDSDGCDLSEIFVINEEEEINLVVDKTDVTCFGAADGFILLTIEGGVQPPLNPMWSSTEPFNANGIGIEDLGPGFYTVDYTDSDGCMSSETVEITEVSSIVVMEDITNATCSNSADGSIVLDVTGGQLPYDPIEWTDDLGAVVGNSLSLTDREPGFYTVNFTDASGCDYTDTYEITAPTDIIIQTENVDEVSCFNGDNGAIDITALGGNGSFLFSWTSNVPGFGTVTSEDLSDLEPGIYTVVVSSGGCQSQETFTLDPAEELIIDLDITEISCFGLEDGEIDLEPGGGMAPYEYSWTSTVPGFGTETTQDLEDLAPGTYALELMDLNDCIATEVVVMVEPDQIGILDNITDVDCYGDNTGIIDITVTTPGITTYLWTNVLPPQDTQQDITDITAGDYSVTVTVDGCVEMASYTVSESDSLYIESDVTPFPCNGAVTGSIDITPFGGTPGYTYQWTGIDPPDDVNQDQSDLDVGIYSVVVTDLLDCTVSEDYEMAITTFVNVNAIATDATCFDADDGTIDSSPSGGRSPYMYDWSGPDLYSSNDSDLVDLGPGDYFLTIADADGCEQDTMITITEPDEIELTVNVTQPTCGVDDGEIDVTTLGGVGIVTVEVVKDGEGVVPVLTGLGAGIYYITATDTDMCTSDTTVTLSNNDIILTLDTVNNVTCFGDSTGNATVTYTGNVGITTVTWNSIHPFTQINDTTIEDLPVGDYLVTVEDMAGCEASLLIPITQNDQLVSSVDITPLSCEGDLNGVIDVIESIGGVLPHTYTLDGDPGQTFTDLGEGTYTLIVTDSVGCTLTEDYDIEITTPILYTASITDIDCNGEASGAIVLSNISGGNPPFEFDWTGVDFMSDDQDIFDLEPGDYNLTVSNANGCSTDTIFTITENAIILDTNSVTLENVVCAGDKDGSIVLSNLGGVPGYEFTWFSVSYSSTDQDIFDLGPGDYNLNITDTLGCSIDTLFTITEPDPIIVNDNITDIICFGDTTGSIETSINGGVGNYVVDWAPLTGTAIMDGNNLINASAGTYTITVTDDSLCVFTEDYTIDELNTEIDIDATVTDVFCAGQNDGSIEIVISGGQGGYTPSWTSAQPFTPNGDGIEDLGPGTYILSVVDDIGCVKDTSFVISQTNPLSIVIDNKEDNICFGDENGTIDITIDGGTPAYNYQWVLNNQLYSNDEDLSDLPGGDYTLTVDDFNDCELDTVITIEQPDEIIINLDVLDSSCGNDDGSATVAPIGGNVAVDYTINWFNDIPNVIGVGDNVSDLENGVYTVEVSDDNICLVTEEFTISDDVGEIISSITPITCTGDADGEIVVVVNGMDGPLTYQWSGGSTSTDSLITELGPNTYTITVTDTMSCQLIDIYEIEDPLPVTIDAVVLHESCPDEDDGSINITATGGTGDLSYVWIGAGIMNAQAQDQSDLTEGDYSIFVTDENDCEASADYEILAASEFTLEGVVTEPSCFEQDNGSIDLTINYGFFPPIADMAYFWTGPGIVDPTLEDQVNLSPGTYEVVVSTPTNCSETTSFVISEPEDVIIDIATTNSSCLMADAMATATVTGGTENFTYEWREGNGNILPDTDEVLEDIAAGPYVLTVTDNGTCTYDQSFVISDDVGELNSLITDVSCPGLMDGEIAISYSGLTDPVITVWTGPNNFTSPLEDLTDLEAGDYSVVLTSADGCIIGDTYTVVEQDFIDIWSVITDVVCNGESNGAIDITVEGGDGDYDYIWTGPDGPIADIDGDLIDIEAGEYTVDVSDSQSCSGSATYIVTEPDEIIVLADVVDATCFGFEDGSISLFVTGGEGPYTFIWTMDEDPDFTSSFEDIDLLAAGTYNLSIVDQNMCSYSNTYVVSEFGEMTIALDLTNTSCAMSTGAAMVSVTGGQTPFIYEWTDQNGFVLNSTNTDVLPMLSQGNYNIHVTDGNGCEQSADFSIQNVDYTVTSEAMNIMCFGDENGQIEITLSDNFIFPETISWTGPNDPINPPSDLLITDLGAGQYILNLQDANGCPYSETFNITEPDSMSVELFGFNINCFGDNSGSISALVNGGDGDYVYEWLSPDNVITNDVVTINDVISGQYVLTVTDALSCEVMDSITVVEPQQITLNANVIGPTCEFDSNGSIEVSAMGGFPSYSYVWSTMDSIPMIENLSAGEYTVSVRDSVDCVIDSVFTIEPIVIFDLQFDLTDASCFDSEDGMIDLIPSGGSNSYDFTWNAATDVNVVNVDTEDLSDLTGGEYYLSILDNVNICSTQDTVFIAVPDSLYSTSSFTSPLCFEDTTATIDLETFGGTAPYTFDWTSDEGFSSDTEDIINLGVGTYNVSVLDSNLCLKEYEFTIEQPDELMADVVNLSDAFCNTSMDGSIEILPVGGTPNYTSIWTDEDGVEYLGNDIDNLDIGTYFLALTDTNNCAYFDTLQIDYEQEIIAVIEGLNPICEQLPVILDGSNSIGANSFTWRNLTGEIIGVNVTENTVLDFDNDFFVLEVSNGFCSDSDTLDIVQVNPLPEVDAGEDLGTFKDEIAELGGNPVSPTGIEFVWSSGNLLSDSTIANPDYLNQGDQEFVVTVTDINGCMNSDTIFVTLNQAVQPSGGFTPNGDGMNDTWEIGNAANFPNMVVQVYNRWGDIILESKGYNTLWDGQYENKELPVGTYYYVIVLNDPLFPKPITGPLTIFR